MANVFVSLLIEKVPFPGFPFLKEIRLIKYLSACIEISKLKKASTDISDLKKSLH